MTLLWKICSVRHKVCKVNRKAKRLEISSLFLLNLIGNNFAPLFALWNFLEKFSTPEVKCKRLLVFYICFFSQVFKFDLYIFYVFFALEELKGLIFWEKQKKIVNFENILKKYVDRILVLLYNQEAS